MENRNRKIIDAVIRKERAVCPGALALIGIYGSFLTGDVHPLSDLDLLILINDDIFRLGTSGKPGVKHPDTSAISGKETRKSTQALLMAWRLRN